MAGRSPAGAIRAGLFHDRTGKGLACRAPIVLIGWRFTTVGMDGIRNRSKVRRALFAVMGLGALIFAVVPEGPASTIAIFIAVLLFIAEVILGIVDGVRRAPGAD